MSDAPVHCRFAVFVDAGYLLAAGGWATTGSYKRADMQVDVAALAGWLRRETGADAGGRELLRLYWYDAAPRRERTVEQLAIAAQPDTKLRLGLLNAFNVQKGVDSLLLTDMIDLAATRSIDLAYLVSGDEDLAEGVRRVQAAGVRLILWGVATPKSTVSVELRNEADRCRLLTAADLGRFFEPVASPPVEPAGEPHSGEAGGPPAAEARAAPGRPKWITLPHLGPEEDGSTEAPPVTYADVDIEAAAEAGRRFARAWLETASEDERDELLRERPQIPRHVDGRLLMQACRELQVGWDEQLDFDARVALRRGFWDAVAGGAT